MYTRWRDTNGCKYIHYKKAFIENNAANSFIVLIVYQAYTTDSSPQHVYLFICIQVYYFRH